MPTPVFEEYEPAGDCGCPGCVHRRRSLARTPAIALRDGGHPAARGARRALVLATAAGVVLTGGATVPAAVARTPAADPVPGPPKTTPDATARGTKGTRPGTPAKGAEPAEPAKGGEHTRPHGRDGDGPASPQGARSPLHGRPAPVKPGGAPGAPSSLKRIDRTSIINRAQLWLEAKVPYSMYSYWRDGYRQDCSGYVSMAWNLGTNEWTGSLDKFATRITKEELLPGDMLLFHNPADPNNGSHVTLFGGWVDETRTHYIAYEQTRPYTRKLATPYGYWNNASKYIPYRYNGVWGGGTAPEPSRAYPGVAMFGPGADNQYVAELGRMLIDRGGRRFYPNGPSTKWSDSDLLATQAFQIAQGWDGVDVDGIPGPHTWQLLVDGQGNDILPTLEAAPDPSGSPARPGTPGSPARQAPFGSPARTGPSGSPARPGTPGSAARPGPPAAAAPPGAPGSVARPGIAGSSVLPGAPGPVARPGTAGSSVLPGAPGPVARPDPAGVPAYPGVAVFRPGSSHPSITALGRRLVQKGFGKYYTAGPGPRWGEVDRRSVEAFQRAQGWRGAAANGYPGPETWRRLFA
ncbi:peptidoglycan-binding protein [Streptomyces sp. NPDC059851]|uniref:peptidoglycan-binding protein n=1 Tax=Streptomyces sp. NPDC059851 TaxID=3346971 RepID=UPI00364E6157